MKKILLLLLLNANQNIHAQNRDSLLQVANSGKKDTNTVKAMRALAGLSIASKTKEAIVYGLKGVELGKQLNWPKGVAGCYLNIGTQYNYSGIYDSVLYYTDSAIKYSYLAGDPNRLALVYINKAACYMQWQAFDKTLVFCDSALKYAELANSNDRRARIFQTLGSVYFFQLINDKALFYNKKSEQMYRADGNEKMAAIVVCNIGNIFDNMKNYDSSEYYYSIAIEAGERLQDDNQLPLYYSSMGETLLNNKNYKEAVFYFTKALSKAKEQEQLQYIAFVNLRLSDLYYQLGSYETALSNARQSYTASKEMNSIPDIQGAADQLAICYAALGNYTDAYKHMEESKILADSLNKMQFDEKIVAKQTMFEVSNKENQIKLLNNEKKLQAKEIERKNFLNLLMIVSIIVMSILSYILWNRYKLKQQLKEVEIRNKIASDLHDDVGATLSSIRMYSGIVSTQVKESNPQSVELLDKISSNSKEMIENMSDIVWMIKSGNDDFKNIEDRMLNFANEICVPVGIIFEFKKNDSSGSLQMPMELRRDLYLIFKEAVNNAVKYSGCTNIRTSISSQNHQLQMRISDDGKGFDISIAKKGNGIANMLKRAEVHKGNFAVHSSPGEGTEIIVSFHV